MKSYEGLDYFPGFDNYSAQPHNTCGQAVIASVLVYAGLDPFDAKDNHSQIIEAVFREHGPNWPFPNWISNRKVITRALDAYGVKYREHVSGFLAFLEGTRSLEAKKSLLIESVTRRKNPVIVLLDVHRLKLGARFTLHWAVVFAANETGIKLSSWGQEFEISWKDFMAAWRVWFVPWPYHCYMIEILSRKFAPEHSTPSHSTPTHSSIFNAAQ